MEINAAATALSALSQETRLAVLQLLVRRGPGGLAAGDIAQRVGAPSPTLSFHLKELASAGLILSRKEGRSVIYSANYSGLRNLVEFLMADCCQGDPRLCGPYIVKETVE